MSGQNWRTSTNANDYFGHQKKNVELEQRRPVVRKASDLVGPGIGVSAVRVTDWNDVLATFNGYYSSAPGALNAPGNESYVGTTVADPLLGGRQAVTGLVSGFEYSRTFVRNASDPSSISWGTWVGDERVPASATRATAVDTERVSNQGSTQLLAPTIETIGTNGTYLQDRDNIYVTRAGVYTGYVKVKGPAGLALTSVTVQWPDRAGLKSTLFGPIADAGNGAWVPFTFWTTGETQQIRVYAAHADAVDQTLTWSDFAITRTGSIA